MYAIRVLTQTTQPRCKTACPSNTRPVRKQARAAHHVDVIVISMMLPSPSTPECRLTMLRPCGRLSCRASPFIVASECSTYSRPISASSSLLYTLVTDAIEGAGDLDTILVCELSSAQAVDSGQSERISYCVCRRWSFNTRLDGTIDLQAGMLPWIARGIALDQSVATDLAVQHGFGVVFWGR